MGRERARRERCEKKNKKTALTHKLRPNMNQEQSETLEGGLSDWSGPRGHAAGTRCLGTWSE
jgi:hypothetical protein